jgi:hypothetical protein
MPAQIGLTARIGAGQRLVEMSHGKEKLDNGPVTEPAPERMFCVPWIANSYQIDGHSYSAVWSTV